MRRTIRRWLPSIVSACCCCLAPLQFAGAEQPQLNEEQIEVQLREYLDAGSFNDARAWLQKSALSLRPSDLRYLRALMFSRQYQREQDKRQRAAMDKDGMYCESGSDSGPDAEPGNDPVYAPYQNARNEIEQAVRLDQNNTKALVLRSKLLANVKGNYAVSLDSITRAIKTSPEDPTLYLIRARFLQEEAHMIREPKPVHLEPETMAIVNRLLPPTKQGSTNEGNYAIGSQLAVEDALKASKLEPKNAEAWYTLGLARASLSERASATDGDRKEAVNDFTRALQLAPEDADSYWHRGRVLESLNRHKEALSDFTRSIELAPDPEKLLERAEIYARTGHLKLACTDCNVAANQGFGARAMQEKGDLLFKAKLYKRAIDCWTLTSNHGLLSPYEQAKIGIAWINLGDWKKAEDALQAVTGLDGGKEYSRDYVYLYALARVQSHLGHTKLAAVTLKKAIARRKIAAAKHPSMLDEFSTKPLTRECPGGR